MATEFDQAICRIEEEVNPKRHCLFLSGGMGTYAGIRGIQEGLEEQYGVGNVDIFNSVFSTDRQNPKRFEQMADLIQKHAKGGLDIVAHSLGAAELRKAIEIVKKRDETFFDRKENAENLHIALVSPSGFSEGIKGPFRFLARTWRFAREQADFGKASKKDTLFRGIDALTAAPPIGISPEELSKGLREAMPELSQYREGFTLIPVVDAKESFEPYLSDIQKKDIATYREMIRSAIENRNYFYLRSLIKAYGERLRKPLIEIYAGNFESVEAPIQEATKATMGGYIGLLTTLVEGFGSKPMKELASLRQKGIRVDFVLPEYDIFMRLDEAIVFFEGKDEALRHIKVAEGVAHAFPALQKMKFGEMVKNLREDKVS